MPYVHRLLGVSATFVLFEWQFPCREEQRLPRRGWLRSPERLGSPGMEEDMPTTLHGRVLWPVTRRVRSTVAASEAPST